MKTLIFIALKILEIIALPLTYFALCWGGYLLHNKVMCRISSGCTLIKDSGMEFWVLAPFTLVLYLALIALIVFIIYAIWVFFPEWIDKNKEWTNNIYNKIKK